jgi:hypothetical protein
MNPRTKLYRKSYTYTTAYTTVLAAHGAICASNARFPRTPAAEQALLNADANPGVGSSKRTDGLCINWSRKSKALASGLGGSMTRKCVTTRTNSAKQKTGRPQGESFSAIAVILRSAI